MSDKQHDSDEIFAERLARVLEQPERFSDDFERSLVAAIRSERPIRYRLAPRTRPFSPNWWRTPTTMNLSPLASMAVAAGLAAVAILSTLRIDRGPIPHTPRGATSAVVHDTVTFVRFVFAGRARSVSLVGDFNRWGAEPTPLAPVNGVWTASIPLPNGRHEYAFIVDGARWVPDPLAPTSSDEFDTKSSIVTVGL